MSFSWEFGPAARRLACGLVEALALQPVDLPARFAEAHGTWKGAAAHLTTCAWSSDRVALFRVVTLAGESLDIANLLAVPRGGAGSVIFGADLVSAKPDAALLVADLSPLDRDVPSAPASTAASTLPPWAAAIFSDDPLLLRLTRGERDAGLGRLQTLATRFVTTLTDRVPAEQQAGGIARYMRAHRGDDRTRTMLAHIFGTDWTSAFVEHVLYPFPDESGQIVPESRVDPDAA